MPAQAELQGVVTAHANVPVRKRSATTAAVLDDLEARKPCTIDA